MIKPSSAAAILKRIDQRLLALDMTENYASEQAGSRDTIRSIRKNVKNGVQRGVSTATLERLAPVLETTAEWLTTGVGHERALNHIESSDVLPVDRHVDEVPDMRVGSRRAISTVEPYRPRTPGGQPVVSTALSAGGGSVPQTTAIKKGGITYFADALLGEIVLPSVVANSISNAPTSRIHWFEVRGDSMEPTLNGGDWVGVNTTDLAIGQGGIFAFRDSNGEVLVKRLRRLRGEDQPKVEIISDNPRQGIDIELLASIAIFGRIVAHLSRVG